jgi:hypothetical protein
MRLASSSGSSPAASTPHAGATTAIPRESSSNGTNGSTAPGWSPGLPTAAAAPIPEVLSEAAQASKTLLAQEARLAKAELSRKARAAGSGAGLLGAAGITALFAVGAFTAAAILALSLVLPAWLAALAVGALYAIVAGAIALAGKARVQQATPLVPEQTIKTLGRLPAALSQAWQRGQA